MKITNFQKIYAVVLGREQKIALAELSAVLRRFCFDFSTLSLLDNVAIIKVEKNDSSDREAKEMFAKLGGAVKVYEINQDLDLNFPNSRIDNTIVEELAKSDSSGTLNFALADYSKHYSLKQLSEMGIKIKIQARKRRPVRFVAGKEVEMSSATSYHKIFRTHGEEFGFFCSEYDRNTCMLGRMISVSNPDEWSRRDYGKPAGDKYSGMMPPKLARSMVNIALGQAMINDQLSISNKLSNDIIPQLIIENSKIENYNNEVVVFDPFCGSGNILMEAELLGCEVAGSDVSERAVEDTKANINWLMSKSEFLNPNKNLNPESQNRVSGPEKEILKRIVDPSLLLRTNSSVKHDMSVNIENSIFKADATTFDFGKKFLGKEVAIVTEPYLGKPKKFKMQESKIKDEVAELRNLYIKFFANLKLAAKSCKLEAICFVFPLIETLDAGSISLYAECIDDLQNLGYNTLCTLGYGRDYQVVKREIVVFNLQDTRYNNQINSK